MKKEFLWSFHYFRAFAIINVFFVHVWKLPKKVSSPEIIENFNALKDILFHGSTLYFIFISGFLFEYLNHRYTTGRYYTNKLKYIILPYLLISTAVVFVDSFFGQVKISSFSAFLEMLPEVYLKGTAHFHLWYIPFIVIIFVVSPLIAKVPEKLFNRWVPFLFLLPLLGTRTGVEITGYQYLYFFPMYLMGMYVSRNYLKVLAGIKRFQILIISVVVIVSALLIFIGDDRSTMGVFSLYESLFYLQKTGITFLIILWFSSHEKFRSSVLNKIAIYSFAIYFTHAIIEHYLRGVYNLLSSYLDGMFLIILFSLVYSIIIFVITLVICTLFKRIAGKYSRYFIGV